MPDHADWLWVRLERPSTDSFMTVCLGPFELDGEMIESLIRRGWPGWEIIIRWGNDRITNSSRLAWLGNYPLWNGMF